jgi:hypothetical protein
MATLSGPFHDAAVLGRNRLFLLSFVAPVLLLACLSPAALAQEQAPGALILDTFSSWRMFNALKPPDIAFDAGARPVAFSQYWLNQESSPPLEGWTGLDFDDSEWLRGPLPMDCQTPFVARTCVRGRFRVTDPAAVGRLAVTVSYHGGAIIYMNGQEVRRGNLPNDASPALAEPYPLEAFVGADGVLLARERNMVMAGNKMVQAGKPTEEALQRMALQKRTLADVEIPARLLRKGVNVLAVEVIRAPYHQVVDEKKTSAGGNPIYDMQWDTCAILELRLSATSGEGIEPNTARPQGFQVWNGSVLRADCDLDFGNPCETLRPVCITGVRNGTFSGKVVAGSTKPIKGLKASATELRGPNGATIPAAALRIRYGAPWGAEYGLYEYMYGFGSGEGPKDWQRREPTLGVLYDAPLAEYPVRSVDRAKGVFGAVAPIWLTVKVPADAVPGSYEGTLSIAGEGEETVTVPVRLQVIGWTLPDPSQFKTWIEMIQSPDTLQLEYGVEPWSDRHWELIARSFRFLREVGSGILYLPLICETNYGNAESMVRWVRKADNQYDFDFSVMDKYLDVAAQNLGRPKIVCLLVWDVHLLTADDMWGGKQRDAAKGRPVQPAVSMLDPATKQVRTDPIPNYDDPVIKPAWQALFAGLRERLTARDLESAMMVGWMCDSKPGKDEVLFWREVTGDLPWVSHSHWPTSNLQYFAKVKDAGFKTGYMTSIYALSFPQDPAKGRLYGWKNPILHAQNIRCPELEMVPGTLVRCMGEINIAGGQRGFGRLGGDYWPAIKDRNGRRAGKAYQRYPQSDWSNINLNCSLLAPGPEGAVATTRFEVLREGVQECEARIFIEGALTDEGLRSKLGQDLAALCQEVLDERTVCVQRGVANLDVNCYQYYTPWNWMWQDGVAGHAWFQSSGWQERSAKLYTLAAEVARKLDEK